MFSYYNFYLASLVPTSTQRTQPSNRIVTNNCLQKLKVKFLMNKVLKISFSRYGYTRAMSSVTPIENSIREKLSVGLSPKHLDIINESHMHNVPKGAETHFKVVVVADLFSTMTLIKRHRLINELLQHELKTGVHALSIVAKTPEQWSTSDQTVEASPNCRGGFGK